MTITGRTPGEERSTPKKEKPSSKRGFGNNKNSEVHSTHLPRHKEAAQLLALLRERHAVFRDCLPLMIGAHDTVRASYPLFSWTAVGVALKFHAHSLAYLKNLAAGGYHYDLTGQPWGLVTPEHQQQAKEMLDARRKALEKNQRSSSPPCANPYIYATPANAGDRIDDVVASRLKGTRQQPMLERKEERPR